MAAGVLRCDDEVSVSMDGAPLCSGVWTLVPVPEPFELSQIDATHAALMFSLGFTLVIPIWFAGMCARAVLSQLK